LLLKLLSSSLSFDDDNDDNNDGDGDDDDDADDVLGRFAETLFSLKQFGTGMQDASGAG